MSEKVEIDLNLLKEILDREARKNVGKMMKRFEILDDKNEIKKEVKELLYEMNRDLYDQIMTVCMGENSIHLINADEERKSNGH
jgi:hypothetical protein